MSELVKIKETITSIELVCIVNEIREKENDLRKLRHDNLVRMIKDEFVDDKGVLTVKETPYLHSQNHQT